MNCLKCGEKIAEGQAFCPNCLRTIEATSVPPDTVLVLPNRQESSKRNSGKKRSLSVEERLAQTQAQLYRCRVLAFSLTLVVAVLVTGIVYMVLQHQKPAVGQNYSTEGAVAAAETVSGE